MKIFSICVLRFFWDISPKSLKEFFDLPVRGMIVETDVKFMIRTLFDYFIFSSLYEEQVQSAFQFREGMVFLDIGAHIGKYTLRAGMRVGKQGKIIAVEPNRDNFAFLVKNIEINGLRNCVPLNIAAYCFNGAATLFSGPNSGRNSMKEDFGNGSCIVNAGALDVVLKEMNLEKVDLVKVDVERAEFEVLKGLESTLLNKSPVVIVEVLKRDERRVIEYMHDLGYEERLLYTYLPFMGGLLYYRFEKAEGVNGTKLSSLAPFSLDFKPGK
jgi:FkbM family methyltransferase